MIRICALAATVLAAGCVGTATHEDTSPPHIVLYLSDDHGVDFAGCYGNAAISTPNLDRLAREGVRFTRMFAASPTCAPSRSVIYTGLYPARNGAMGNHTSCRAEGLDTKAVGRLLAEHPKDRPLCLVLGDNSPHVTWETNKVYRPDRLPVRKELRQWMAAQGDKGLKTEAENEARHRALFPRPKRPRKK